MQAIILAAGLGTRLRPLTHATPKPLVEIAPGRTLLGDTLARLVAAGCERVIINRHHLGEQLVIYVAGFKPAAGLEVIWSPEEQLLGTGGALRKMLPRLAHDEPALVISGDVWTEFPLASFAARPVAASGMHLLLVPNPAYHPEGDFDLVASGDGPARLATPSKHSYTYGGVALIDPALIGSIDREVFSLAEYLELAIKADALSGEVWRGSWFNVGTAAELMALKTKLTST